MKKHIIYGYLLLGAASVLASACNDNEKDLLEPKVYFEKRESTLSLEDNATTLTADLTSRLSAMVSSDVEVSYSLADADVVKAYNAKYGTFYELLDASHVQLSNTTSVVPAGKVYAKVVQLQLAGLDRVEEGKTFVVPVRVHSSSAPTLPGASVIYYLLSKPVQITKVGAFRNEYVSVRFPAGTYFRSFTFEALINVDLFGSNNTIMGNEGTMILRIGDEGGGISRDILQVAGNQHYEVSESMNTNRWYHVALTYDQPTGKTALYVNGSKWAESAWSIPGFDPNGGVGFNIGKIPRFPWGERPFYGKMSEVRVWSVSRTENQIKENMKGVDPKSEGLELYFKFDGSEVQENGEIKDAVGRAKCTTNGIEIETLGTSLEIK